MQKSLNNSNRGLALYELISVKAVLPVFFITLISLLSGFNGLLSAQNGNNGNSDGVFTANVSINATATVVDAIEMSTLNNINLGSASLGATEIFVNPQSDETAGKLLITGRPNAAIRITYVQQRELTRIGGSESLTFRYFLSGNTEDNQFTSETLDLSRTNKTLGSDGRFYIWIGGLVNIYNAVFGQYEGEFSVEIEYI